MKCDLYLPVNIASEIFFFITIIIVIINLGM